MFLASSALGYNTLTLVATTIEHLLHTFYIDPFNAPTHRGSTYGGNLIRGEWPKNYRPQYPGDRQEHPIISLQEQDQALSPPPEDLLLALGAYLGIRLSHPHFPTLLGPHFPAVFK